MAQGDALQQSHHQPPPLAAPHSGDYRRTVARERFNPKRRLREPWLPHEDRDALCARATYAGNPAHKLNPGDFGLTPPASPRPDKTLCDRAGVFARATAQALLESGIRRGLVSSSYRGTLPRNIWAVSDGVAFEAQLENEGLATYHGYPMLEADPLRAEVIAWWGADVV